MHGGVQVVVTFFTVKQLAAEAVAADEARQRAAAHATAATGASSAPETLLWRRNGHEITVLGQVVKEILVTI